MKNHGFELPLPKPRRNNRHDRIEREEGVDIGGAVSYLEEAERGAVALTHEVRKFASAAEALLDGGLTDDAVAILIQSKMKNQRNGRPFPHETILEVLTAAARLSEHLKDTK